ncbi:MAG: hypothetical protein M3Y91_03145 [Actinomycetota bacterium]|nr:hypothetical protein [Actinomycetota bacterium]
MGADAGNIDVTPGDLTSAGGVVGGAGTSLQGVASTLSLWPIPAPGFQTATQLTSCCSTWSAALAAAATAVSRMGSDLVATAGQYQNTEQGLTDLSTANLVTS